MKVRVNQGFTIIELIIGVIIAGILLSVAAPSFTSFMQGNSMNADIRSFVGGIQTAKTEAVTRAENVTFRPRGGNWSNGWEVVDTDDTVIQRGKDLPDTYSFSADNGTTDFVFNARGRMTPVSGEVLTVSDGEGNSLTLTITGNGTTLVK